MSLLTIVTLPHPVLRKTALPVTVFDQELATFTEDMLETMYTEKGIGLAANQVNVLKRVIIADCSDEHNEPLVFINPEIFEASEEMEEGEEGCLSLPTMYSGPVLRHISIKLRAQNVKGDSFEFETEGLLARCIQHEIDHLNGKLFIDYLSRLKQERIIKRLAKVLKEREEEQMSDGA